jgi:N-acetylneuraminic acid mutarotase
VVYSPEEDALFSYGGVAYPSNYSSFQFFSDTWVFRFSTNTWSQLAATVAPGARAGMGCDYIDGSVIMTHGSLNTILSFKNETWRWDLGTNTWTLLDTSTVRPIARSSQTFKRIPGTNKFLFANGQVILSPIVDSVLTDVWIFDSDTLEWKQSVVSNVPQPPHDSYAEVMTSNKWFLMAGGDADGNKTVVNTCFPPLQCRVPVTPTKTNYFLRLKLDLEEADWEDDEEFEHSVPPHRRASIVILEPYLYLVGGMGWNGKNGVGEIYNPYTWAIQLKNKYFQ